MVILENESGEKIYVVFEEIQVGLIEQLINAQYGTLRPGQSKQAYPHVIPVPAFDLVHQVNRDAGDREVPGMLLIRQDGPLRPSLRILSHFSIVIFLG